MHVLGSWHMSTIMMHVLNPVIFLFEGASLLSAWRDEDGVLKFVLLDLC